MLQSPRHREAFIFLTVYNLQEHMVSPQGITGVCT